MTTGLRPILSESAPEIIVNGNKTIVAVIVKVSTICGLICNADFINMPVYTCTQKNKTEPPAEIQKKSKNICLRVSLSLKLSRKGDFDVSPLASIFLKMGVSSKVMRTFNATKRSTIENQNGTRHPHSLKLAGSRN